MTAMEGRKRKKPSLTKNQFLLLSAAILQIDWFLVETFLEQYDESKDNPLHSQNKTKRREKHPNKEAWQFHYFESITFLFKRV